VNTLSAALGVTVYSPAGSVIEYEPSDFVVVDPSLSPVAVTVTSGTGVGGVEHDLACSPHATACTVPERTNDDSGGADAWVIVMSLWPGVPGIVLVPVNVPPLKTPE
jgi:hypothetical protein